MKHGSHSVFVVSALALCLLLVAYQIKVREVTPSLPATPQAGFAQMIRLLKVQDIDGLSQIVSPQGMKALHSFQGKNADTIYVHDFLVRKGVKPAALKQPWGLWTHWAKQMDLKKIKVEPLDTTGEKVLIVSESGDWLIFVWQKTPAGWRCEGMPSIAGGAGFTTSVP